MRASSDLYDLVKCLSPSEKRYFKLNAGNPSQGNKYMWIFEIAEKHTVEEEAEIVAQIKDPKTKRQFPVMKAYLHKQLLKSLRNFHSERSTDIELRELLTNAEILIGKKLYLQCQKQLDKAEKLALRFEKFDFLLQVAYFRMSLIMQYSQGSLERLQTTLGKIFFDLDKYLQLYQNLLSYKELSLQMLVQNRREQQIATPTGREAYDKLFANPLIADPVNAVSNRARLFCCQSRLIFFLADGDFGSSFDASAEIVSLMETMPELLDERPENYINSLQNLITVSTLAKPAETSLGLIAHLKKYRENIPSIKFEAALQPKVDFFAINLELQILLEDGRIEEAAHRLEEVREVLGFFEEGLNFNEGFVTVSLHFKVARLALSRREHRIALEHLNYILNDSGIDQGYDVFANAKMLQVMVYFDAGESELLESALLALYRVLQKRKSLKRFDKELIKALRKLVDLPKGKNLQPWFRDLLAELRAIVEGDQDSPTQSQKDIFYWLDAKLKDS